MSVPACYHPLNPRFKAIQQGKATWGGAISGHYLGRANHALTRLAGGLSGVAQKDTGRNQVFDLFPPCKSLQY